jgi:hypothetical protein
MPSHKGIFSTKAGLFPWRRKSRLADFGGPQPVLLLSPTANRESSEDLDSWTAGPDRFDNSLYLVFAQTMVYGKCQDILSQILGVRKRARAIQFLKDRLLM